jgi:flagellar biosynthesis protein
MSAADATGRGRERAVALQYGENDAVPRIVSSGAGELARAIIELARESGVPLRRDPTLADMLAQIPVGSRISPETYRLVAEVITFLYHVDGEFRAKHTHVGRLLGGESGAASSRSDFVPDPPTPRSS